MLEERDLVIGVFSFRRVFFRLFGRVGGRVLKFCWVILEVVFVVFVYVLLVSVRLCGYICSKGCWEV